MNMEINIEKTITIISNNFNYVGTIIEEMKNRIIKIGETYNALKNTYFFSRE